ncbi:unnamed protein product [Pocillopora meandrina]|uniref:Metallo-beta-lactamase domain-containing protein 1 n=1 Tax=Pocillopora meandrina TaxID=46732 RepID=A0AAU9Y305_9CNID|nr:unnamed protein product [Pocillopora meandrina]
MAEEGALYKVSILLDGYGYTDEENRYRANGTSTLITGPNNRIIVDTGSPRDKQRLLDKLKHLGHTPEEVNFVVCTHGHIDHVGNLNLFRTLSKWCLMIYCKSRIITPIFPKISTKEHRIALMVKLSRLFLLQDTRSQM